MVNNNYLVLDLETSIKEVHKRKGNPWFNDIIAIGYSTKSNTWSEYYTHTSFTMGLESLSEVDILIGHNIKYDLLYLWNFPIIKQYFKNGGKIWDTQLAEYILSGQQHKFPALRDIAVNKYKRSERSKKMEEYWEKEIDTKDIPRELVEEDVLNDVLDTKAIYLKQLELAEKEGQLNLIQSQMDGLLSTIDMEYNGIQIDLDTLNYNYKELQSKISKIKDEFISKSKIYFKDIDINSSQQIGILFFGGEIKEIIKEPKKDSNGNLILFKSGKNIGEIKFENKTIIKQIKGLELNPFRKSEKTGKPSTDDQTLQLIVKMYKQDQKILIPWRTGNGDCDWLTEEQFYTMKLKAIRHPQYKIIKKNLAAVKLANLLLKYREINKQIGTYYKGVLPLIYKDGKIHHKLHHVKTDTGRLSSSDPNLQNQPSDYSQVKDHFISRFENGSLISLDFSQLEICVQAGLSKDKQYIQDIINGIDFHIKRLALKEHKSYEEIYKLYTEGNEQTKQDRTKIKSFSFARAYGAGANKISEQTGMSEEEIKELIKLEEQEYPQLTKYNQMLKDIVESNKKNGYGWYQSFTGRKYYFKENEAPEWLKKKGKLSTFMPTQIINYIVQGTATADIVLIMLGKLWRKLQFNPNIFLINTVHDDILLDVANGFEQECINIIKKIINSQTINEMLKQEFNIDWQVPIDIKIKVGKNWGNMHE